MFTKGKEVTSDEISTQKMVDDLRSVARDAEALIKGMAHDMNGSPHEIRERLSTALASGKETILRMEQKIREKAIHAAKATDKAVRAHPYESIGAALGIGLILGYFIRRK